MDMRMRKPPKGSKVLHEATSKQGPAAARGRTLSISGEAAEWAHQPGTSPVDEAPNAEDQHKLRYSAVMERAMPQEPPSVKQLRSLPASLTSTAVAALDGQKKLNVVKATKRALPSSLQRVRVASPPVEPNLNNTASASPEFRPLYGGSGRSQHQLCPVPRVPDSGTSPQLSWLCPDEATPVKSTDTGSTGSMSHCLST